MGGVELLFNGHRVSLWVMKTFWEWAVVMVAQNYEFA
jgi:hypothetical protein